MNLGAYPLDGRLNKRWGWSLRDGCRRMACDERWVTVQGCKTLFAPWRRVRRHHARSQHRCCDCNQKIRRKPTVVTVIVCLFLRTATFARCCKKGDKHDSRCIVRGDGREQCRMYFSSRPCGRLTRGIRSGAERACTQCNRIWRAQGKCLRKRYGARNVLGCDLERGGSHCGEAPHGSKKRLVSKKEAASRNCG